MSDDKRGGVSRNRSGSGLQLNRSTKGIQNSRRSFRGLGKGTLDNSLGKIGGSGGGKKPVIADDLSIDDSVLESDSSEIGERTRRQAPKGPSLLGGGGGSDSESEEDVMPKRRQRRSSDNNLGLSGSNSRIRSRTTSRESVRLPARKNSNRQRIEVPRSDNAKSSEGRRRRSGDELSLSKSDHQRPSSRKVQEDELSISKSDHVRSSRRRSRGDEDFSRSSVAKTAFRRSNTFGGKTVNSADSKQHAVKGIYKLLDSMENKEGINTSKEKEASSRERKFIRRSKTADSGARSRMGDSGAEDKTTATKPSIQGIRNLLDKSDHSLRDHSMKDKSQMEKGSRGKGSRGRRRSAADDESDSDVSEKNRPTRGEEIGTNHSASLQGIQKLLGSMNKDASATASKVEKEKARDRSTSVDKKMNRSARSLRRLQSHQLTEAKAKAKEAEEAAKQEEEAAAMRRKEKEAAANKRKEEEDAAASRRQARKDASRFLEQSASKLTVPDDDEGNDYDSVATPKTATGPPPPLMKEAPPPPQRKNVARKPRNMLPNLAPPKPKATNATIKSAPPTVPATPMRSPGGIVIDMQHGVSTPGAGCSTPQNFSTPQAAAMPAMPATGFDSISTPSVATPRTVGDVATPRTVGDVAPPPVSNAPPPPPKRNMDMGSRWKNRRQSRVPTMHGQAASNVLATPGPAPKAPSMTMLSPGGIVIEVSSKKSGIKGANRPPEPMTPMAEMTPMASKSGLLSNSPYYNGLRNNMAGNVPIVPSTPCMQQSRSGSMANGSWMSTPSMQSNSGDISELTPGTFVGSHRMTPRDTPRSRQVPSTPSLYNSPGVVSELTPGGYSVGLLGDDDYVPSGRDDAYLMTPRTYGILLEEADEDEGEQQATLPSTPSLASPAGVVSEATPDGAMAKRRLSPVAPLHVPATPSHNDSNTGIVSELTPGTSYGISAGRPPIPTTPSVHSPAGVVSEMTPLSAGGSASEDGVKNIRTLSNLSNHSGVVSDITPGSFSTRSGSTVGQVQIAS